MYTYHVNVVFRLTAFSTDFVFAKNDILHIFQIDFRPIIIGILICYINNYNMTVITHIRKKTMSRLLYETLT